MPCYTMLYPLKPPYLDNNLVRKVGFCVKTTRCLRWMGGASSRCPSLASERIGGNWVSKAWLGSLVVYGGKIHLFIGGRNPLYSCYKPDITISIVILWYMGGSIDEVALKLMVYSGTSYENGWSGGNPYLWKYPFKGKLDKEAKGFTVLDRFESSFEHIFVHFCVCTRIWCERNAGKQTLVNNGKSR